MEEREGATFRDYTLIKRLDDGITAHVWLAIHNPTKIKVALKLIERSKVSNSKNMMSFICCITLMKHLKHPLIARYIESIETNDYYIIVIQFCENGTLEDLISRQKELSEDNARKIFIQIVLALEYMHNKLHMAHRDLKPQNILLDKHDIIHLTDFGLSKSFSEGKPLFSTFCGTPKYIAPEILHGQPYSAKADIWSLGVILYFMVYNKHPFNGSNMQELTQMISFSDPEYKSSTSSELLNLLQKLLNKDPEKRPSINEILNHKWLNHTSLQQNIRTNIEEYISNESCRSKFANIGEKIIYIENEMNDFTLENKYSRRHVSTPPVGIKTPQKIIKTSRSSSFVPRNRSRPSTPIVFPKKKSSI